MGGEGIEVEWSGEGGEEVEKMVMLLELDIFMHAESVMSWRLCDLRLAISLGLGRGWRVRGGGRSRTGAVMMMIDCI